MTTKILTYTPSLMEKILGKHYKWWYIILYNIKLQNTYRSDGFLYAISSTISYGGSILVWFLATMNSQNFNSKEIITYLLIGGIIIKFFPVWYGEELSSKIAEGKLISNLISPTPIFWYGYFQFLGKGPFGSGWILNIPSLFLLFFFWNQLLPISNWLNIVWILLFLIFSYTIKYIVEFLFGSIAFWTTGTGGLMEMADSVSFFLIGGVAPLTILSNYVNWIEYQPFAWILHHPMQIYLGNYDLNQTLWVFAGGLVWCLALYFLAKFVFKMGLKRNESVGL
jgi:ABC-2 type transport system permease protein